MKTEQEIAQIFEEMGLGTEEKRARFIEMSKSCIDTPTEIAHIFVRGSNNTKTEEETENAKLARNSQ